jgi:hypothetical protein
MDKTSKTKSVEKSKHDERNKKIEFVITETEKEILKKSIQNNNDCCPNDCLRKGWKPMNNYETPLDLFIGIRRQLNPKTSEEKKDFIRDLIIGRYHIRHIITIIIKIIIITIIITIIIIIIIIIISSKSITL